MSINRVLIGGGSGFIGRALALALEKQSIQTWIVSRMPAPYSLTWDEVKFRGFPNVDAVINLSGQNVLDPMRRWTPGFQQNVISSRVETNRLLSAAIRKLESPPKVFVTISGVGYYPPSETAEYTEDSPGGDFDFLSRLCTDWEAAAAEAGPGVRTVAVRSGIVLGKGGGMIKEMYPLFYLGLGAKIGNGKQWMPWIHLDDLIAIFIEAMRNEALSGVINGVAPGVITNGQFTRTFARSLWRPNLPLGVPEKMIELVFGADRAVMMTKGQKVTSQRLTQAGFTFKYPDIDSALKQICS